MQLRTMFSVASKATIAQDAVIRGLDYNHISGETGQDVCEDSGDSAYWRLPMSERQVWDETAGDLNSRATEFWINYLHPVSTTPEGVADVLGAVLYHQLSHLGVEHFEVQVNANLLIALFPFLHQFTARDNTMLLDIFASPHWYIDKSFRLFSGTDVLFSLGKPTVNLIEQMIPRALSWTKPYDELNALIAGIGLPVQKHWSSIGGRRIIDLCNILLSPERPRPPNSGGRTVPGDKILQVAMSSPGALKALLPVVLNMCRRHMISTPEHHVLTLAERFGVYLESDAGLMDWLHSRAATNPNAKRRLLKILEDAKDNYFEIKAGLGACSMCYKQMEVGRLLRCSKCVATLYCSVGCQRTAWGDGHKAVCKATEAAGEKYI